MPRATVTKTTQTYPLQSVPGGQVEIRRMTYGEKLSRQDDLMSLTAGRDSNELSFNMANRKAALFDFANLIVSHNLTDENDRPLNFKNVADVVKLDPAIGEEIGNLIDKLNAFETSDETAKS